MFAKLWKRSVEADPTQEFEFSIARQHREPLRFNGILQFESIGCQLPEYLAGDLYHNLRLYKLRSEGYAVVVEFHREDDATFVEAAIVDSVADVDDFFCLHAGDYFHHMVLDPHDESLQNKQLEQRVLKCYDLQLLNVSKHLSVCSPVPADR